MPTTLISKFSISNLREKTSTFIHESVWPGLGLFGESYLLFSVGTLYPLWERLYPHCLSVSSFSENNYYKKYNDDDDLEKESCPDYIIGGLTNGVVLGVIVGMVSLGGLGDVFGRRIGSLITSGLMSFGAFGLLLISLFLSEPEEEEQNKENNNQFQSNPTFMFGCMVVLLFVFGLGVGGEYPLSASSASEKAVSVPDGRCGGGSSNMVEEEEEPKRFERLTDEPNNTKDSNNNNNGDDFRGRRVILVFAMQGLGVFIHCLTLTLLLLLVGGNGSDNNNNSNRRLFNRQRNVLSSFSISSFFLHSSTIANISPEFRILTFIDNEVYTTKSLLIVWNIIYAIAAIILIYVFLSRYLHLKESSVWAEDRRKRLKLAAEVEAKTMMETTIDGKKNKSQTSMINIEGVSYLLVFQEYGTRLFGTGLSWLLWDVAFYGNKLFQSTFLLALTGEETTLLYLSAAATLNAFIALLGYFAAAFIVDKSVVGRLKLQQYGLLITGALFLLCGTLRSSLSTSSIVLLYLASSFSGQCGPNCTTFLLPAEVFPTRCRTLCHGLSAGAGKIGALVAAIFFRNIAGDKNKSDESVLFLTCGICCILAYGVTTVFVPESLGLDLLEMDCRWRMVEVGNGDGYVGQANDPTYLSWWERRFKFGNKKGLGSDSVSESSFSNNVTRIV